MTLNTRPKLIVSLAHLIENYRTLLKVCPSVCAGAVVKDDAYGLGAKTVVEALYHQGCRVFFVAHACEGLDIRPAAPGADIYVLQGVGEDSFHDCVAARLTPVLSSLDQVQFWQSHKIKGIKPMIQVETGLNRLGVTPQELCQLNAAGALKEFSYILSHLACANDTAHFMNARQLDCFEKCLKEVNLPATFAASDGVFLGPRFHFSLVRLGAAMYGLNTAPYRKNQLLPVMYVSAPVLQVFDVDQGDYIGYGAAYEVKKPMKIAVVSMGYGDGLPRRFSPGGHVFLKGKAAPLMGRISMDNIVCDVTHISNVHPGDYADILNDQYGADDMAKDTGTIGYEILSNMGKGKRYCRFYQN